MKTDHHYNATQRTIGSIGLGLLMFATLLLLPRQSPAQATYTPYIFTTFAGGGGYKSPDTPGNAVRLNIPTDLAVDSAGNIVVMDTFNYAIRKVTPAGEVTTLAGWPGTSGSANGTGSVARFFNPYKLALDNAGNVYVCEDSQTIRKVTPEGIVTTIAGRTDVAGSTDGIGSVARFNLPTGAAIDSAGNIYVCDAGNHTIRKLTPIGSEWMVTTIAGTAGGVGSVDGTNRAARFNFPQGLGLDAAGNLYVADSDNFTVRKVTPVGTNWVVTTLAGRAGNRGNVDGTNSAARF